MPEPEVVTLDEAIVIVKGVARWLQSAPEGTTLQLTPPAGSTEEPITYVHNAAQAGRVLATMLLTMGCA